MSICFNLFTTKFFFSCFKGFFFYISYHFFLLAVVVVNFTGFYLLLCFSSSLFYIRFYSSLAFNILQKQKDSLTSFRFLIFFSFSCHVCFSRLSIVFSLLLPVSTVSDHSDDNNDNICVAFHNSPFSVSLIFLKWRIASFILNFHSVIANVFC